MILWPGLELWFSTCPILGAQASSGGDFDPLENAFAGARSPPVSGKAIERAEFFVRQP
ncbi:hypothetical protein EMIT051CA3_20405 [Pseudomonas chlororaphis]